VAERQLVIPNAKGLHVRAATALARTAGGFESAITVRREGDPVDAKSIMGLLLLTAAQGSTITVCAEGDDAADALEAVAALVESGFGE
jgi:phosphocarrier protein HPr